MASLKNVGIITRLRRQNSRLSLKDVNSNSKKQPQHASLIPFIHDSQSLKLSEKNDKYPEFNDDKEIKNTSSDQKIVISQTRKNSAIHKNCCF